MKFFGIFLFCACVCTVCYAETRNLIYKNGDEIYTQNTCTVGGDLMLPNAPTKIGYNFVGWKINSAKELQYVTFNKNLLQYIDTGISFDSSEIEYEIKFSRRGVYTKFFGAADGFINNYNIGCQQFSASSGTIGIGAVDSTLEFIIRQNKQASGNFTTNPATCILNIKKTNGIALTTCDDVLIGQVFGLTASDFSTKNIWLGGINAGEPSNTACYFTGSIYYFKIKKDGVLVLDMVPAKDSNGIVCMYDKISKKFLYTPNGQLGAGPEVQ